jgi:thiol-disulfide isomerase/thioredoxin
MNKGMNMRVAVSLLLVALVAAAPASAPSAAVGSRAPAIPATALDGTAISGQPVPGKVTVLNFWATWCPPCRAETPDMIAAYKALKSHDVAFLAVDTTETAPIVKTFISAKGVTYPVALAGPQVYNAYGIAYIPTTIVIDAHGVVRARWTGGVTPAQLAHYVADAKAGRSSTYVSPVQTQIDGMLARSDTAPASVKNTIALVDGIVARNLSAVDYERTQNEEGALLVAAANAQRAAAQTPAQKVAVLLLLAQGYGDQNRWADAVQAYQDALAIAPSQPQLVASLSRAYYRLHDYDKMIAQAIRYTQLEPKDGDGWSDLGLAYQRARRFTDAAKAYAQSLLLLEADAAAKPTQDAIADVADTSLDAANVAVALGDASSAQQLFANANAYGDRLKPGGDYATLKRNVKERTQEGLVAVALAGGAGKPVVSIVPWTGADFPGSLASTLKYRLIVAAPASSSVTLHATGLRPDWVASFCADGLCSPQTVTFTAPASGVKTFEFQLVPPQPGAHPGIIRVTVDGGASVQVPASGR